MDTPNSNPAPAPQPPAPAPNGVTPPPATTADQPRTFTQEEVNAIVSARVNEVKTSLTKRQDPTPAAPPPPAAPPQSNDGDGAQRLSMKALQEQLEATNMRNSFNEAIADAGVSVKGAKRTTMLDLFKAQKPQDAAAWVAQMNELGMFHDPKQVQQQQTQAPATQPVVQTQQQLPPQSATPNSDKGAPAPGGVLDFEREVIENPIGASKAAIEAYIAKHGEEGRQRWMAAARAKAHGVKVLKPQG